MTPNKNDITNWFKSLQDDICAQLEGADGEGKFREDKWERPGGGGGRTRIIEGKVIEKGGVNFSAVHGPMPEKIAKALNLGEVSFYATGVSIVLHPVSPMVPIIHMNVRYFQTENKSQESEGNGQQTWWFGGGIDLTPHFIDDILSKSFHHKLKSVCDKHSTAYYPEFKQWADDYFFVKHRNETRGIGGIFFDRLGRDGGDKKELYEFVIDVGKTFLPIYEEQFLTKYTSTYSEREKQWQLHRRGRYVEFNLVWDRGTKFGLETGGNIESILMSLPPNVCWTYRFQPNEIEQATLDMLKKGVNWVGNT